MRCICWFLVVILVLLICVPLAIFIGLCAPRCFHPKKINQQTRLVFNSTRLPSITNIVTTTSPITEKEEDESELYIKGSFTGGEKLVPENDYDSDNKFRTKNDLASESKLKLARLETDKPIKTEREPKTVAGSEKRREVDGFMKGRETENSTEDHEEWKKASFESTDTEKPMKAVRTPVEENNAKEESSERYLIEESKNSNSTETHEESNKQGSSQKRGFQLNDEPGKMEDHEPSPRFKQQKDKGLKTNRMSQSEEYDEMEEEQLIVKTKSPHKNISHD